MYSLFELVVACALSTLVSASTIETMHFLKDRKKKEKASK